MSRFFDRRLLTYACRERLDLVLTVTLGALSGVLIVLAARVLAGVVNGVFLGGSRWRTFGRCLRRWWSSPWFAASCSGPAT